ncbi:unknown function [Klebsiella phage vB_Kpn_K61PH164C1]|uniref:Uncharacterized protein n=1 Tax=Klebsiella phage vB_Kpn_K61PH164C1 TaxID=3071663 RepID=A0AAV1MJN7_9CAUD|nr:unknown function [Klebsiella phage vB_Kpn_K61PH164C1]
MTTATVENVEILDTTPVRDQVAAEIITLLNDIGSNYLKIGALLAEGREDFDNQRDFLEWADCTFGIKKTQCYNLMNISHVFATRKEFSGVAMRVLLMLVPFADDGELMDKAADMAAVGELDTAAANQLLGKPAKGAVSPALAAVKQALAAQQATQEADSQAREITQPAPTSAPQEESASDASFDTGEAAAPTIAPVVPDAIQEGLLSELKKLREDNAALHARIMELTATRETKKASAPMLPQFKSKCMYARLGLSVEQSMSLSAVNKAKRELVKLGYGEGHDAWPLIQEAVEALGK